MAFHDENDETTGATRREFLLMAAGAGLTLVVPAMAFAGGAKWIAVGKSAQFIANQPRPVVLPNNGGTLFITRNAPAKLNAVSAVCTHKGCIVAWDAAAKDLKCPCHGALFAADGKNLKGPRNHPDEKLPALASVPVKEIKGQVMIDISGLAAAPAKS